MSYSFIGKYGKLVSHRTSMGKSFCFSDTKAGLEVRLREIYGFLRPGLHVGRKGSLDRFGDFPFGRYGCFALTWPGKNGRPVESRKLYVLFDGDFYSLREKTDYVRDRLARLKQYQVIGGQYEQFWYGQSDTLRGAKMIAARNKELWDNWQGWHAPEIYRAEDCMIRECQGMITKRDGQKMVMHFPDARPVVNNRGVELDDGYGY